MLNRGKRTLPDAQGRRRQDFNRTAALENPTVRCGSPAHNPGNRYCLVDVRQYGEEAAFSPLACAGSRRAAGDDAPAGEATCRRRIASVAPRSDSALIQGAIAAAAGVALGSEREPLDALVAALDRRSLLIVLDNCEHLIEAAARVAEALVERTRDVRLLVTSRLPLKVREEQIYRLGPLSVPSAEVCAQEASAHGAVALFIDRAHAADRRFELTDKNVGTVVEICRRLDGIPLALELAGARVQALGSVSLAAMLEKCFQVLTGGRRTAPARHRPCEPLSIGVTTCCLPTTRRSFAGWASSPAVSR
ncbi:MAG TPA: hypothetical protein VFR86_05860 [Burkholderiaceae bacterium]|nr:hypothetical protein [Burkholderiaceae bacterium]